MPFVSTLNEASDGKGVAVRVVTAADAKYRNMFELCKACACRCGYGVSAYDLGGLGEGALLTFKDRDAERRLREKGYYYKFASGWMTKARQKPEIMYREVLLAQELLLWLDADAMLMDRIDEIDTRDYDLGVVLRCPGDSTSSTEFLGLFNAGVIAVYPTAAGIDAMRTWIDLCERLGCDQKSLNHLVEIENSGQAWHRTGDGYYRFATPSLPELVHVAGLRVKLLPWKYNCYIFPPPTDAKVLHFKGKHRKHFDDFKSSLR